ncbi:GMC oxidoreductase [Aeromicrobium piscarium]|uniref:Glucose-methanol-choline oxidoreductase C-terminal domain-containing protein n=1 Tax=Aeromicrobium piscarium TaxID=2590901 RepID=A0A554SHJ7_9ACTN|nr:hypothetical protein FNM00_04510 [Aeromicrobium piscarium]
MATCLVDVGRRNPGLRVVDASVFPAQPSGNNSAPTQAAAWIAADMILEDAKSMSTAGA